MNFSNARSYSTKANAIRAALGLPIKHVPVERVAIVDGKPFARWFLLPATPANSNEPNEVAL